MKKVIELALKSGEITLTGIINLVNCIDEDKQERAVMLLTENNDIPDEVSFLTKGISINSEGNIDVNYKCIDFNYLKNEVMVEKELVSNKCEKYITYLSINCWKKYRENYINQQIKEREEYLENNKK